jgi:hypothetical protein
MSNQCVIVDVPLPKVAGVLGPKLPYQFFIFGDKSSVTLIGAASIFTTSRIVEITIELARALSPWGISWKSIDDFLRQQEEKDYLSAVEMRIATTINRLARQVEKGRAEQQLVVGVLDGLREWLAFTLPPPADKVEAQALSGLWHATGVSAIVMKI